MLEIAIAAKLRRALAVAVPFTCNWFAPGKMLRRLVTDRLPPTMLIALFAVPADYKQMNPPLQGVASATATAIAVKKP